MKRTALQALLAITGMAALAMATSCFSDLSGDFQQLEGVSGEGVAFVKVDGAATEAKIHTNIRVAQQFTPAKYYQVHQVWISMSRVGTFTDDKLLRVSLCSDSAGNPNSTDSALAYDVKLSSIPETQTDIVFAFNLHKTVIAGTPYWIKIKFVDETVGDDVTNYIKFYYNNDASSYTGGLLKVSTDGGTSWNEPADDGDLGLQLWGLEVLP